VLASLKKQDKLLIGLVKFACVSEKHKDGDRHLHAYLLYSKKVRHYFNQLDKIVGKHGNYQKVKKTIYWLRYILKSQEEETDASYRMEAKLYSFRDGWKEWSIEAECASTEADLPRSNRGQAFIVMNSLKETPSITYREMAENLDPSFLFLNKKRIEDHIRSKRIETKFNIARAEGTPFVIAAIACPPNAGYPHGAISATSSIGIIANYLNEFVDKIRADPLIEPAIKENVIVLHGGADTHKSSFHQHLARFLRTAVLQSNGTYLYNGIMEDYCPELVVLENFNGSSLTFEQFEAFVDCDSNQLFNAKYGSLTLSRRPLIMICTNTPPANWWSIRRIEGDGSSTDYDGSKRTSTLLMEHKEALYARLTMSAKISEPIWGFPKPTSGKNLIVCKTKIKEFD